MWPLIVFLFVTNILTPTITQAVPETEIKEKQQAYDSIYIGCGTTKTCFGFPDSCVAQQGCQALVTAFVLDESFQFELISGVSNVAYVALGLSSDDRMGDDAVMECVPEGGNVRAFSSWNTPRGNTREGVPQNIISLLNASLVDETIYCKLEREPITTILGKEFDLVNNKFHLMLAIGSSATATAIARHDLGRFTSSEPLNIAVVTTLRGRSVLLLRLHGAFMLTAWIGAASVGILLARYFKQTWVGRTLCGKDQWFAWHRLFMIATWTLTIAGFVIIFVELGGWSAEDNPHAILGTITTVLCFIQPFMAIFRPGPIDKTRPIFNWAHWLVGNLAHLFAIVTTFFAVQLSGAQLPSWFDWILLAFVGFHALMHLILSIIADISNAKRLNSFSMKDDSPKNSIKERKTNALYSGLRKGLLTIYLIIVTLFVITLVVIAVLAPID